MGVGKVEIEVEWELVQVSGWEGGWNGMLRDYSNFSIFYFEYYKSCSFSARDLLNSINYDC